MATTSTIPEALRDLFDEPALAHVSYLNRKGQIVTYPMWVDFDGEHLMVSSPVGSRKGKAFRERPQVAVSIVSTKNPWHWLSVSGRVVDIQLTTTSSSSTAWRASTPAPTTSAGHNARSSRSRPTG